MGVIKLALVFVTLVSFANGRSTEKRTEIDAEANELTIDQRREPFENDLDIDIYKAAIRSGKRDCTSPMCWFRPGKRGMLPKFTLGSSKRKSNDRNGESCNSPMCWFRAGKKRAFDFGEIAKRLLLRKPALKRFLHNVMHRHKKLQRQVSEDNCDSPMCWFRPGRQINDEGKKKEKRVMNMNSGERYFKTQTQKRASLTATGKKETSRKISVGRGSNVNKHRAAADSDYQTWKKEYVVD